MAAVDMSAKPGMALVDSDAGTYLAWSGKNQPAVAGEGIGCGLLVLKPLGFAMPHYDADASKFGYVLGGSAVVGVLLATWHAKERVVRLEAGDVIAVRVGDVSWWYNDADGADFTISFIGDTACAHSPGDISYFFLAGAIGLLSGVNADHLSKSTGTTTKEQAATAFRSQPEPMLTKLGQKLEGVHPREHDRHGLATNAAGVPPRAEGAGLVVRALGEEQLPSLRGLGFSAWLAQLEEGAVRAPWVVREPAAQAVYVARGGGRVQITSKGGAAVLDADVTAGSLFVVPPFAAACVAAGADGMETVSLIKSSRPVVEHLIGNGSLIGGITPQVMEAALNVAPDLVELLRAKGSHQHVRPPNAAL